MAASDHVLQLRPLNRFIEADWENGEICAEAGVTLGEILQLAIPRGWFLRVTPGTRHVTLGGAVANDVHGKNHHRCGTFAHSLVCFELHRSVQSPMVCSLRENPQWFAATIGGLGLTGVITWVRIRLRKIQSSLIDSTRVRFDCLDDFFALSADMDAQHEYSVAWIDCLAKGNALGRGCFTAGDHCVAGRLEVAAPRSLSVPIRPPVSLINSLTLKLFNDHYWKRQPALATARSSIRWTVSKTGIASTDAEVSSNFSAYCRPRLQPWHWPNYSSRLRVAAVALSSRCSSVVATFLRRDGFPFLCPVLHWRWTFHTT
jgi:FAD/FMN-containing dehydrogenase